MMGLWLGKGFWRIEGCVYEYWAMLDWDQSGPSLCY